jgi:hypothetical protein
VVSGAANATDGIKAARFNAGQKPSNAALSQSFATTPGRLYTLTFDYGVYSPVSLRQQRLQVTVQGSTQLLSQLITQSAFSSTVQYSPKSFTFTANSTSTTLSFGDASLITDSVDSYLDNVQVK